MEPSTFSANSAPLFNTISTVDVFANLPSSANAGDIYWSTDNGLMYRYTGTAWQAFYNNIPLVLPPTTGWSWLNQGTATVSNVANNSLTITGPADSANSYKCYVRSAPATPWILDTAFLFNTAMANYATVGIVAVESSTGKFYSYGFQFNGQGNSLPWFVQSKYTNTTTFSSDAGFYPYGLNQNPMRLRFTDNGTLFTMAYSNDGITWVTMFSESRTAWLATGVNQIGLTVCPRNASYPAVLNLLSWYTH